MTLGVSDLMRMLRQRPQPDMEQQSIPDAGTPEGESAKLAPAYRPEPQVALLPHQADESSVKHDIPSPSYRLASIPVDLIQIDPHQPRRTLPDDLRDACAQDHLSAREAIFEFCRRAHDGDRLAMLRVEQLRGLAGNLREVGLEYPPKVVKVKGKDGSIKYRIKDGERRYWAWLLLLASADAAERAYRESIPAMVEEDNVSAEHILRSQWATNLQRERVPVVDIADYVLSVRDTYASRLQVNPQPWIASLGTGRSDLSVPAAVAELTSREVAAIMGKRMSRSTLFRYLAIAEKLRSDAKAIARVRQFGLRQCEWLARLSTVQQLEAAQRMKPNDEEGEDDNAQGEAEGRDHTSGAGRPKLLDGRITMLVRIAGEVGREKEVNLRKADPVKLQELRQATTDAIGALQSYVRLIDHSLSAATPNRSTGQ